MACLGAAVCVALAACSSAPAQTPVPSGEATDTGNSSFDKLFAQIRPDGTVGKQTALEAFAFAIAPLPGVTPPTYPPLRGDGVLVKVWLIPQSPDAPTGQLVVQLIPSR